MTEKILSIILKEKKLIGLCVLGSFSLFVLYSVFIYKPFYKTDAKIFIRNLPTYNATADAGTGDSVTASQSGYSNPLFNIVQILESESLSNKIYSSLKPKYPKEFAKMKSSEAFHDYFKKKLKAKIVPSTDTINLSLNWSDKNLADTLLLETILQFKNENLGLRKSVETKQREYFDNYLKEIETKLTSVRQEIRNYRISNNVIDTTGENTQILATRYEIEREAAVLRGQIKYNDKKLASYSRQLGFDNAETALRATAIGQDPYLETLNKDRAVAQQKYANLTGKFGDIYPEVIAVKNEISSITSNIDDRSKESLQNISVKRGLYDKASQDTVYDMARVQAETVSLRAQLTALLSGVNTLKSEESKLPDKILNLEELTKQEDTLKSIYDSVKKKQTDAKFKENEIVDNIFILDSPSVPKKNNTDLLLSLLGFLYTGAMAGVLAGWVKESPESLFSENALNNFTAFNCYKQIGNIPYISSDYFKADYNENGLIKSTESVHGTSYIDIASNLIKLYEEKQTKVVSFIGSSSPLRNSSLITTNIAANLARLGKSVILISSDFRCSEKIKDQFKVQSGNNKDLIDIINSINLEMSSFKYITSTYMNNLIENGNLKVKFDSINNKSFNILPVNSDIENLYDYVSSKGFEELINFLKAKYDFVLIDMPAKPASYPACAMLMQKTDLNVMIAATEVSPKFIADKINELKDFNLDVSYVISREIKHNNYKIIDNDNSELHANTGM